METYVMLGVLGLGMTLEIGRNIDVYVDMLAPHFDCGGAALPGVLVVVLYLGDERDGRQRPVWNYQVFFGVANVWIVGVRLVIAEERARHGRNVAVNAALQQLHSAALQLQHAADADDDDDTEAEPEYGDSEWSEYDTEGQEDE